MGKLTVATKSGPVFLTDVNDIRPAGFTDVVMGVDIGRAIETADAIALSVVVVFVGLTITDMEPRDVSAQGSFRVALGVSLGSVSPDRDPQVVIAST